MGTKILVVDDEPETLRLLSIILELNNFETMKALNGTEALKLVNEDVPDAMLLDIMLPDIDGLEICRRLRRDKSTAGMAILMITASSQADIEELGVEAGADRVLRKPVTMQALKAELDGVLRKRGITRD